LAKDDRTLSRMRVKAVGQKKIPENCMQSDLRECAGQHQAAESPILAADHDDDVFWDGRHRRNVGDDPFGAQISLLVVEAAEEKAISLF
jgi:hypothetical protein